MCWVIISGLGYIAIILGSVGMILYRKNFGFATSAHEDKLNTGKILGTPTNAYNVWMWSWGLIIGGTILQFTNFINSRVCPLFLP